MKNKLVHDYCRSDWRCVVCGSWWPCLAARQELIEIFEENPSAGTRFLSQRMQMLIFDACARPGGRIEDFEKPDETVYHRFLLWYVNAHFSRRQIEQDSTETSRTPAVVANHEPSRPSWGCST